MNKDELIAKFEANVAYLKRNVPPEEIYQFAEQTYMASLYFLFRWKDWEDLNEVMQQDIVAAKWIRNILALLKCREMEQDVDIDLNLEGLYEDNPSG